MGGRAMRWFARNKSGMAALLGLAPWLGACSSDASINLPHPERMWQGPGWLSFSGHSEEFTLPPPAPRELVDAEGRCAASTQAATAAAPQPLDQADFAQGGIALQMTECEVVRRAGAPEQVEVGKTPAGERSVVLTYTRGPRSGIYRFAGGRLFSIERAPEAPAPARQSTPAQPKKRS
jgi:hypothetical protein